jgi:hypothetical protein
MKTTIIAISLLIASASLAANNHVESIPACGNGHVEVFAPVAEIEFPSATVKLTSDTVQGIKGYLSAGLIPAICLEGKNIVFASR